MSPEQQRICIAEACGWTRGSKEHTYHPDTWCNPKGVPIGFLPDYLNDLNAMHEAEQVIQGVEELEFQYAHLLDKIVPESICPDWALIHATASQRAEAMCRVLHPEKWPNPGARTVPGVPVTVRE